MQPIEYHDCTFKSGTWCLKTHGLAIKLEITMKSIGTAENRL